MSYTAAQVQVWNGVGWEQPVQPFWAISRGTVTNYTSGTFIPYPGTAHTNSAWVEIVGSASAAKALTLSIGCSVNAANTSTLIEIAKGSAGSEATILAKTPVGSWSSTSAAADRNGLFIPVQIADGDRISARIQGARTSGSVNIYSPITIENTRTTTATALDVIGADLATSRGVALSDTPDVYVEVIGSAEATYNALIPIVSAGNASLLARTSLVTIATGAAGSEVDLFQAGVQTTTTEVVYFNGLRTLTPNDVTFFAAGTSTPTNYGGNNIQPVFIPQGTRIAAKISSGTARSDIAIIGVRS